MMYGTFRYVASAGVVFILINQLAQHTVAASDKPLLYLIGMAVNLLIFVALVRQMLRS